MKALVEVGLCCLGAVGAWAAGPGAGVGGVRGGGHGGIVSGGRQGGFAHNPGRIFSSGFGRGERRFGSPFGYGLWGYGGLYGGFWGDYEPYADYGYSQAPAAAGPAVVVLPMSGRAAAPVVEEVAHPVMHDYTQPAETGTSGAPAAERGNQPVVYLIAFHDGNIRAAMTYWVDHGTLHYLDTGHKQRESPLTAVDRDLSAQLNRERHVPFGLE